MVISTNSSVERPDDMHEKSDSVAATITAGPIDSIIRHQRSCMSVKEKIEVTPA